MIPFNSLFWKISHGYVVVKTRGLTNATQINSCRVWHWLVIIIICNLKRSSRMAVWQCPPCLPDRASGSQAWWRAARGARCVWLAGCWPPWWWQGSGGHTVWPIVRCSHGAACDLGTMQGRYHGFHMFININLYKTNRRLMWLMRIKVNIPMTTWYSNNRS